MNELNKRDFVALEIFKSICAGDWKFDIKEQTWDEVAIHRAFMLADAFIDESNE
jgi:hypothetical protein